MTNKNGLQIFSHSGAGYRPLVDYASWRVAVSNPADPSAGVPESMQRHNGTDEVFVLLSGKCVLFIASDKNEPEKPHGELLEPKKIYNVPKGYWHASYLTEGASVLIVENSDTAADNSPVTVLSEDMRNNLRSAAEALLK